MSGRERSKEYCLTIGTKKFPVGVLLFTAHREFRVPNSIRTAVEAGHWSLSFSNGDYDQVPDEEDVLGWLQWFSQEELRDRTFGGDRGLKIPMAGNHGGHLRFSARAEGAPGEEGA